MRNSYSVHISCVPIWFGELSTCCPKILIWMRWRCFKWWKIEEFPLMRSTVFYILHGPSWCQLKGSWFEQRLEFVTLITLKDIYQTSVAEPYLNGIRAIGNTTLSQTGSVIQLILKTGMYVSSLPTINSLFPPACIGSHACMHGLKQHRYTYRTVHSLWEHVVFSGEVLHGNHSETRCQFDPDVTGTIWTIIGGTTVHKDLWR